MKRLLSAVLGLILLAGSAAAQSPPKTAAGATWPNLYKPTITEWVNNFTAKQDYNPDTVFGPGSSSAGNCVKFGDTSGHVLLDTGAPCGGSGGGSPGGSSGQIQFNNVGSFGGLATSGTGNVALTTNPTIVSPTISGTGTIAAATMSTTGAATIGGNIAVGTFEGWSPLFKTNWNSLQNGVTAGGSGYATGDLVTMSDGTIIAVTGVSSGVVTHWIVSTPITTLTAVPTGAVTQSSTTGSGTGLQLTLSYSPVNDYNFTENVVQGSNGSPSTIIGVGAYYGAHSHALGNTGFGNGVLGGGLAQNGSMPEGLGGCTGIVSNGEHSAFGFQADACLTTATWASAFGTGSNEHETDGGALSLYGTDSAKYGLHNNYLAGFGTGVTKFIQNGLHLAAFGDNALSSLSIAPTVSAVANNGSGLARLTVSSTTGMTTGDAVYIWGMAGYTAVNTNGTPQYINVIDGTHLDVQGSTYAAGYTSGGFINDFLGGQVNLPVLGTSSGTAGVVRLKVAQTFGLAAGLVGNVSGVGGTTEANGSWTIAINAAGSTNCSTSIQGGGCFIDLVGTTFTNAWTSGGQITMLRGPQESAGLGTNALSNAALSGSIYNVTALGAFAGAGAISLSGATIVGSHVGPTNLGSTGQNIGVILMGVDGTTDVASGSVVDAVGIGRAMKLMTSSVQVGDNAGGVSGTTGTRVAIFGNATGTHLVAPIGVTIIGDHAGATTCVSPSNVLILATGTGGDCSSANESGVIHIGTSGGDVIKSTATTTPSGATTTIAGALISGNGVTLADNHAPAIATGFGTLPAIAGTSSAFFKITIGSGGTVSTGTVTLTSPTNGWSCSATDITTAGNFTRMSTTSGSGVTLTNYNAAGTATAWPAADVLMVSCTGG